MDLQQMWLKYIQFNAKQMFHLQELLKIEKYLPQKLGS